MFEPIIKITAFETLKPNLRAYESYLSEDEQTKMQAFQLQHLREYYALGRGFLREQLGLVLNEEPAVLVFDHADKGKPYLKHHPLHFNVSHSGDYFMLGIASEPLGVDIEKLRDDLNALDLAKRFFHADEVAYLQEQKPAQQVEAFYRLWVCKESVIKALGLGLHANLNSFSTVNAIVKTSNDWPQLDLKLLDAPDGYQAAICLN